MRMLEEDQLSPWQVLPDSVILHIFSFIDAPTLLRTATTCKSWNRVAYDEFLWKDLFCREWKLSRNISRKPGKQSWREEYRRLKYHTPMVESEVVRGHTDEVLHVSFSHNGEKFATCSKDCSVKVWNAGYPATLRHSANMINIGLAYTEFSQFNDTDTLLLVSGIHHGLRTTGEIVVFSVDDEFEKQSRILINPFSIFGTWFNDTHLLSGQQSGGRTFVLWLTCAYQKTDSQDVKKLFEFIDENEYGFSNIMVANTYSSSVEDYPAETQENYLTNQNLRQDLLKGVGPDEQERLLIFMTGSRTYGSHQIGFKRFKPSRLRDQKSTERPTDVMEKVLLKRFWNSEDETSQMLHKVDHLIDMHGHIIGMALSPDQRYLYANIRAWPDNYEIEYPDKPPPIAAEIDIHVIDLIQMRDIGVLFCSHKTYTTNQNCFFLFPDVCDEFVASGAEDKHGYLWDRHYGICLSKFRHNNFVNCVAFNPVDSEMLITASDDHTLKIWRSKNCAQRIDTKVSKNLKEELSTVNAS